MLKPLVILQLLISIGALVLGILLFGQREVLKKRTQNLEKGAADFAESIRFEEFNQDALVVKNKEDFPNQQRALSELAGKGQDQWQELQDTIQVLAETREDLRLTKEELATTKTELGEARDEIAQLSEELRQTEAELAQANSRIGELETDLAGVRTELEELQTEFANIQEERDECLANYESLEAEYNILVRGDQGDIKGLFGKVLIVNPEWNFVVLDIGSERGLVPAAEMLVHRSDRLIGRVRITSVDEEMAVAEIMGDWEERTIRSGDLVISPES